jgi:hypothetical protein
MSSETRQYIEELLVLSPWVAFIVAIAWFWMLGVRDNARASRAYERARPRQSDSGSSAGRARISNSR